jgi:predicted phosphodiesterase
MSERRLVLSDVHFGTPQSSINDRRFREPLVKHIADGAPWKEIVFTGDLLDANLSTLRVAIEGRRKNGVDDVIGFRGFLEQLDAAASARGGLAGVADGWIYVPGNHDYKVWDLLSTRLAFEDVLERGEKLGATVSMPVREHAWTDGTSFFAGMFKPFHVERRVTVEYPNHVAVFGPDRVPMVFTHGHYLDPSQTRGNDLARHLEREGHEDPSGDVREIFIETAQYQAVASAVSYTADVRGLVDHLVGPDGVLDKLRNVAAAIGTWVLKRLFVHDASLRGKALSDRQLANIRAYLTRFCRFDRTPRWFVFGHTHAQCRGEAKGEPPIQVWNAGSCYPDHGLPITFLEVEDDGGAEPAVRLMCVDASGAVHPSPE